MFSKCYRPFLVALVALTIQAVTVQADVPHASFALIGEEAAIPYGWVDFCNRQPQECEQAALPAEDLVLSSA